MKPQPTPNTPQGFSLIEMMIVLVIFIIVSGAVFGLLGVAQERYRSEQEFLDAFQNARVGVDQITREVHNAGNPRPFTYTATPDNPLLAPPDLQRRFAMPFAGTPTQTCTVGVTCVVPNGFNLAMEMDLDPGNVACPEQVEMVEYTLVADPAPATTSTLMRRVQSKAGNAAFNAAVCAPLVGTGGFVPFVENAVNNPADPTDPVFSYICIAPCTPETITSVRISLRVQSMRRDPRTRQYRVITLNALARPMTTYP